MGAVRVPTTPKNRRRFRPRPYVWSRNPEHAPETRLFIRIGFYKKHLYFYFYRNTSIGLLQIGDHQHRVIVFLQIQIFPNPCSQRIDYKNELSIFNRH